MGMMSSVALTSLASCFYGMPMQAQMKKGLAASPAGRQLQFCTYVAAAHVSHNPGVPQTRRVCIFCHLSRGGTVGLAAQRWRRSCWTAAAAAAAAAARARPAGGNRVLCAHL